MPTSWQEIFDLGTREAAPAAVARSRARAPDAGRATTVSTSVFHAAQDGHWPDHFGDSAPHCWQTYKERTAGIAAHVIGVSGIEANSRQYCPAANHGWVGQFPGVFDVRDGMVDTARLDGSGLGAVPASAEQPYLPASAS